MPSASTGRRLLLGAAAAVGLALLAAPTIAWSTAATTSEPAAVVVADALPAEPHDPPGTTSTTATSTSSTSTSSTSTSTSVRPRSVPTTSRTRPTVPAPPPAAPVTAAPVPVVTQPPAPPSGPTAAERCAGALQWVAQRGLALPAGWGFRCPGQAVVNGTPRWGMACWNCEGNGSWIAVDIARIGASDATLRHVVAHEICHAVDYMTLGLSTEIGADLCAALHGAPRP